MKNLLFSVFALVLLISCGSVKKHNEQITKLHTVEDLHSDIDKVYKQLKKHHPKLYQYTPKEVLDFKFDSLKSVIKKPINSRDFYKKLAPVITYVKQGHVSLGSVNKKYTKKERKELKKKKFEFYDLDFEYLDSKLWIINTRGKDSTLIGSEVVKIENDSVFNLVEKYKTRFTSDGYNKTLYNRYVGKRFSGFYYKDKGFKDSLKIQLKQKDSLFTKIFRRVLKKEKKEVTDSVKPIIPKKLTKLEKKQNRISAKNMRKKNRKFGFIASKKQYTRNFNFIGADNTVAYMKIRGFSNGNYKPFYKESFKKLDSAKTKNFIIDLRDNGGGRVAEIDYLYSYLTNTNYKFIEDSEVNSRIPILKFLMSNSNPNVLKIFSGLAAPFIMAHNIIKTKKQDDKLYYKLGFSKEKKPKGLNYKGNLYVLINGNSFSASSLLSTHLKATKRAVFVGEETGGAYNGCVAGIYKIYQLPNTKLKIRMGLMQIETPYTQSPDGYGVKPDIEIAPTIENRLKSNDVELENVLSIINK